jgi:hypothetical protein
MRERVLVVSIDSTKGKKEKMDYDKEKYKEMILDVTETVLGFFGFDRTIYGGKKIQPQGNGCGWKS